MAREPFDLGEVDDAWRGFIVQDGLLWTPERYNVGPGDVRSIPYRIEELHEVSRERRSIAPLSLGQMEHMDSQQLLKAVDLLERLLRFARARRDIVHQDNLVRSKREDRELRTRRKLAKESRRRQAVEESIKRYADRIRNGAADRARDKSIAESSARAWMERVQHRRITDS